MKIVGVILLAAMACYPAAAGSGAILGIVQDEFVSVDDILDRYTQLDATLADTGDARQIFVAMLRLVTEEAAAALDDGYFEDGDWTVAFLLSFNNLYRQALFDYESGYQDNVPEAWRVAFDAALDDRVSVFTHALLGIHAHVNHDLPFAIAEVVAKDERDARLPQFSATNAFLLTTVDAVEDLLAQFEPSLGELDASLGDLDEWLLDQTLTQWRFNAWRAGARLDPADTSWRARLWAFLVEFRTGRQAHAILGR